MIALDMNGKHPPYIK